MKKLNKIFVIAKKEIKEILSAKRTLIVSLIFAGWFGYTYSRSINTGLSIEIIIYIFSITLAAFLSFILSSQIFVREKYEKTIIDLLCAPISLGNILAGKVMGVFVFAYGFNLLSLIIVFISRYYQSGSIPSLSLPIIFHIIINIPLFIAFAICLNGLIQLLLGIKENRIAYFIVYIIILAAVFSANRFMGSSYSIGWLIVLITFAIICVLLLIIFLLTRISSKERIITRIE
jgi:ABC-type Na+ efflux pump permease subunit